MKLAKRGLAILLVLTMLLAAVPLAFAEEEVTSTETTEATSAPRIIGIRLNGVLLVEGRDYVVGSVVPMPAAPAAPAAPETNISPRGVSVVDVLKGAKKTTAPDGVAYLEIEGNLYPICRAPGAPAKVLNALTYDSILDVVDIVWNKGNGEIVSTRKYYQDTSKTQPARTRGYSACRALYNIYRSSSDEGVIQIYSQYYGGIWACSTPVFAGTTLQVKVTPKPGYRVSALLAYGNAQITRIDETNFNVVMPYQNVTLYAIYETE